MALAPYTFLERTLHRLAFSTLFLQRELSELEDIILKSRLRDTHIERPVFITSLPRAGTTLLLNFATTGDTFASHTYRSMPFVLLPLIWRTISKPFWSSPRKQERFHGDGVVVDFDSPEALEEVLWNFFWPDKYGNEQIELIRAKELSAGEEFEAFLKKHIKKLLSVSHANRPRYISKNNANISRIAKIYSLFPDATFLVPFRNPMDHAASMHSQHLRFLELQKNDPFIENYMKDLGHFEFGKALAPINFNEWLSNQRIAPSSSISFWLQYWAEAFEFLLANRVPSLYFINYERLCSSPKEMLEKLSTAIAMESEDFITTFAKKVRPASRLSVIGFTEVDPKLQARIVTLHSKLCELQL